MVDNAGMKQRIGEVMILAPWTRLNLKGDDKIIIKNGIKIICQ